LVDYPIPCNDDSIKAISLMAGLVAQAVNEGKAAAPKPAPEPVPEEKKQP
jgi:ribosomal protein S2